jgi:FMN phosphatase YigB (HAD superfamily)
MPLAKLLLDYDGVILRSPRISSNIQHRCENFVRHVTGIQPEKVPMLNRRMYESHGHTVLGLRALGFNVSSNEFNSYIYQNLSEIPVELNDINITGLKQALSEFPNDTYIFSNAPQSWITYTMSRNETTKKLLDKLTFINPKSPELFKPDLRVFLEVRSQLYKDNTYPEIFFVDDSLQIIANAIQVKNWTGFWLSGNDFSINTNVRSVSDLESAIKKITLMKNTLKNNSEQKQSQKDLPTPIQEISATPFSRRNL